mgnify:CR=1 FL=1
MAQSDSHNEPVSVTRSNTRRARRQQPKGSTRVRAYRNPLGLGANIAIALLDLSEDYIDTSRSLVKKRDVLAMNLTYAEQRALEIGVDALLLAKSGVDGVYSADPRKDKSATKFEFISYDDAEAVWVGSYDQTSRPLYYTFWEDQIHLWPKPDTVYPLVVRGYRKSNDWSSSDSTEVDADARLHQSLVYYGVAQIYQLQEDVELATFYRKTFDEAVRLAISDIMRPSSQRPFAVSDGAPSRSRRWWLQSLGRTLGQ